MPDLKQYTEANRQAWNEAMPYHQKANRDKWDKAFSVPGFVAQSGEELELLKGLDVSGKRVAHLSCNNGVELMSLENLGATQCVGFDISDEAIQEATQRAKSCGLSTQFVRSDVFDIPDTYNNQFDMVYISIGCLGWLPDVEGFFGVIARLLKKDGVLFAHEMHPFCEMLPSDDMKDANPMTLIEPYFKEEPYVENSGIDYIGNVEYEAKTQYWFVWTLSDIMMSMVKNGLALSHFTEYPTDISACHERNQEMEPAIPLSYILMGKKT